jgi:two-component system response regulator GlrR
MTGAWKSALATQDLKLLLVNGDVSDGVNGHHCKIADLLRESFDDYTIFETNEFSISDRSAPGLILLHSSITPRFRKLLAFIRQKCRAAPLVGVVCGEGTASVEVFNSLISDMDDFLFCPVGELELISRVRRLMRPADYLSRSVLSREIKEKYHLESLVGESDGLMRSIRKVPNLARSDATVLILGETGTGKELFARAIHYLSSRQRKSFVPVNCGAIPDQLFENEFFGHMKGAFTDAFTSERGLLSEAEGGTLFLDEVDALSASAQVKLLRFLQNREYRVLGSPKSLLGDVRVIGATNADLRQRVAAKAFRHDLYQRLNILHLSLSPLRERLEDVPHLANHFLTIYSAKYGRSRMRLSYSALQKLISHSWPGNVRELETVIHRAVATASSSIVGTLDLEVGDGEFEAPSVHFREAKSLVVDQFERAYLVSLLTAHQGNVSRAAEEAGKPRRALQRLLRKHRLDRSEFSTSAIARRVV